MTKEGFTKIVTIMTPGQGSCARVLPYKSCIENALFLLKSSSFNTPRNRSDKQYI